MQQTDLIAHSAIESPSHKEYQALIDEYADAKTSEKQKTTIRYAFRTVMALEEIGDNVSFTIPIHTYSRRVITTRKVNLFDFLTFADLLKSLESNEYFLMEKALFAILTNDQQFAHAKGFYNEGIPYFILHNLTSYSIHEDYKKVFANLFEEQSILANLLKKKNILDGVATAFLSYSGRDIQPTGTTWKNDGGIYYYLSNGNREQNFDLYWKKFEGMGLLCIYLINSSNVNHIGVLFWVKYDKSRGNWERKSYKENMLLLHGISYTNIGPFAHRTRTVRFHHGKFLIKAPIGSGKSFLFFDGPLYGLYKYSSRKMVNTKCESGAIKLWFSVDDQHYLVVRKLKKGKSKDRCQSQLFLMSKPLEVTTRDPLQDGVDMQELMFGAGIRLDETTFKNESDLQQNLTTLLPPREVFLSTAFLMQDAPNIFELTPAERIEVFKNIFGLLGIDEAKDVIAEKKREVQASRKVKSDHELFDRKLRDYLTTLTTLTLSLEPSPLVGATLQPCHDIVKEWQMFEDKLAISAFSMEGFELTHLEKAQEAIHKEALQYDSTMGLLREKKQQLSVEQQKITSNKEKIRANDNEIVSINTMLGSFDPKQLQGHREKKVSVRSSQKQLEEALPHSVLTNFVEQDEMFAELFVGDRATLVVWKQGIDGLMQRGKHLKAQKELLQQRIDDLLKQEKLLQAQLNELELKQGTKAYDDMQKELSYIREKHQQAIERMLLEHKHLKEKEQEYVSQQKVLKKKIGQQLTAIESASVFRCEKIASDCPYITMINNKSLKQLDGQLQLVKDELAELDQKYADSKLTERLEILDKKLVEIKHLVAQIDSSPTKLLDEFMEKLEGQRQGLREQLEQGNYEQQRKDLGTQLASGDQRMTLLKQFLEQAGRKQILESYDRYFEHEQEAKKLEEAIAALEKLQLDNEKHKERLLSLQKEQELLAKQNEEFAKQVEAKQIEVQKLEAILADEKFRRLAHDRKSLEELIQTHKQLSSLLEDYKLNQREVLQLQEREKRLQVLYTVFSKELLFVVLQSTLPTLNEIINSYLAQVVDYTISMTIEEENDKLVMYAIIEDDKGQREISSLSGGQKTVLKLVWMLSVVSFMRSRMLFLDETINNLDKDTVGLVADMLHDFIQQHSLSFYTVTHSEQIQEMGIWDTIINV